MPQPIITGNSLLDKLASGPYVKNPNYNPKTKAGKTQPPVLLDTSAGDVHGGAISQSSIASDKLSFTYNDTNMDLNDIHRDEEMGITYSPYNSEDELNKVRAEKQSAFAKTGDALEQALVGEMILGTMEGFGDIFDGIANIATQGNWAESGYTKFWRELKEQNNDYFKINQANPEESWQLGDWGWWMQNLVSTASTVSLMIPAAGWARGIGAVGKAAGAAKLGAWATRGVSRGIGSAMLKFAKDADKYSTLRNATVSTAKMFDTAKDFTKIGATAFFSRTGENMQEGRQVYNDVYTKSKDNLENMPAEEYAKFLARNSEFEGMSKDEIAKEIARKSMMTTFANDYWMLAMDIPQFKALGSLWGLASKRATTAGERIAAANVKSKLAGVAEDKLIKNNFINRQKEAFKYMFKSPLNSWSALELGEGIEEGFQGIQQEKGMEVATKYFNPNFTPRTIESYLTDGHIWEQAFWGAIGGIVFKNVGEAVSSGKHAIDAARKKKHMTADEYERWKKTGEEAAIEEINGITANATNFINQINTIAEGKNPFNYVRDVSTGRKIINAGQAENETINEDQKDLLRQDAINNFIDKTAFDAIDRGNFDLIKDILSSDEFNQYFENNGIKLTAEDKNIAKQVVNRLNHVGTIYRTALSDMNAFGKDTNPYAIRLAAQNIAQNNLRLEDYDLQLANVEEKINRLNTNNTDYTAYTDKETFKYIQNRINAIKNLKEQNEQKYKNKEISKSAYETYNKQFDKHITNLLKLSANYTKQGMYAQMRENLKKENYATDDMIKDFDTFMSDYNKFLIEHDDSIDNIPGESIKNAIAEKIDILANRTYTEGYVPYTYDGFKDMYNEFTNALDTYKQNKLNGYVEDIKKYLDSAEDLDEAINKLINEDTGNRSLDRKLQALKYGYINNESNQLVQMNEHIFNETIKDVIKEARKKRVIEDAVEAEAKEDGLTRPTEEESKEVEDGAAEGTNDPSTGDLTESEMADNLGFAPIIPNVNIENNDNNDILPPENAPDESIDGSVVAPADNTDEKLSNEQQDKISEEVAMLDSETSKATAIADTYISKICYTQEGKIKEISDALANNDDTKIQELVDETVAKLVEQGIDKQLAERIVPNEIVEIINAFGNLNTKSPIYKLAQQLAKGINEANAKDSITELLSGEHIDTVVEPFLEEYSKYMENTEVDGKKVINIQSVFNLLIDNEHIDLDTAVKIFDNLGKYISIHDGSKYVFTGFDTAVGLTTSENFFNRLQDTKAKELNSNENLHIGINHEISNTIEYKEALEAVANKEAECTISYNNIGDTKEKDNNTLYINVTYNKKGKKKTVVVGVLRTINTNDSLTKFYPRSVKSNFVNAVDINESGGYSLDCDFLFNALINQDTADGKNLYYELASYIIRLQELSDKFEKDEITINEFNKQSAKLLDKDAMTRIMTNPLIEKLLNDRHYILYGKNPEAQLINDICAILFYRKGFNSDNLTNQGTNTLSLDKNTIALNYKLWQEKVYNNYKQTYELQKQIFNDDNVSTKVVLNVDYFVLPNHLPEEERINIGDNTFITDKNNPRYTPFVYINNQGHIIGEDGTDYGNAFVGTTAYTMGFMVYNKDNIKYIDYLENTQQVSNDIKKDLLQEVRHAIGKHINNTNDATHEEVYNNVVNTLTAIFGNDKNESKASARTLFHVNGYFGVSNKTNDYYSIMRTNKDGSYTPLITFYKYNKGSRSNAHAIGVRVERLSKQANINSLTEETRRNDIDIDGTPLTNKKVFNELTTILSTMFDNVTFGRTENAFTGHTESGGNPILFRKEGDKFITTINNKEVVYDNYADFLIKNRAFRSHMNGHKGFLRGIIAENNLSIDTRSTEKINRDAPNKNVSDILFDKNTTRKTVDTVKVLAAAGVTQEQIDILTGKNTGVKIITDKIVPSYNEEKQNSNAYYDTDERKIYVTPKGAISMNNNPTNAIRLILHENIHRHFHNTNNFTDSQRKRIIDELEEVYNYTMKQLDIDVEQGIKTDNFRNNVKALLAKAMNKDRDTNMEEFLVECLTQPMLVNYLNNTDYRSDSYIDGIPQKKKSILQKIMDILLKLLGFDANNIRNSSILAREYAILSKTDKSTNVALFDNKEEAIKKSQQKKKDITQQQEAIAPVENKVDIDTLNETKNTVDNIIRTFESRIKRSDNFKEDHTYYIDGQKVDTSVTQVLHGKQDLGQHGVAASYLGNTADDASRIYFEEGETSLWSRNIPNVINDENKTGPNTKTALIEDIKKIETYLDNKFGKGKYRVVTKEFPIGGKIEVNGEMKTIAGTMDMLVYTDDGKLHIFDFKTKRQNTNGEWSQETIQGYYNQVNIYRQLLEANFPELKGRIETGALIKFFTMYDAPSTDNNNYVEYRYSPTVENQLQARTNENGEFFDIQDKRCLIDYRAPYFVEEILGEKHIFDVPQKDYPAKIESIGKKPNANNSTKVKTSEEINQETKDNALDNLLSEMFDADTELLSDEVENEVIGTIPIEIYSQSTINDNTNDSYGVEIANDIHALIRSYPMAFQDDIKQSLAENELQYVCS